jgi:hypothetical protein
MGGAPLCAPRIKGRKKAWQLGFTLDIKKKGKQARKYK